MSCFPRQCGECADTAIALQRQLDIIDSLECSLILAKRKLCFKKVVIYNFMSAGHIAMSQLRLYLCTNLWAFFLTEIEMDTGKKMLAAQ